MKKNIKQNVHWMRSWIFFIFFFYFCHGECFSFYHTKNIHNFLSPEIWNFFFFAFRFPAFFFGCRLLLLSFDNSIPLSFWIIRNTAKLNSFLFRWTNPWSETKRRKKRWKRFRWKCFVIQQNIIHIYWCCTLSRYE